MLLSSSHCSVLVTSSFTIGYASSRFNSSLLWTWWAGLVSYILPDRLVRNLSTFFVIPSLCSILRVIVGTIWLLTSMISALPVYERDFSISDPLISHPYRKSQCDWSIPNLASFYLLYLMVQNFLISKPCHCIPRSAYHSLCHLVSEKIAVRNSSWNNRLVCCNVRTKNLTTV